MATGNPILEMKHCQFIMDLILLYRCNESRNAVTVKETLYNQLTHRLQ